MERNNQLALKVGQRIEEARRKQGYSQKEFAKRSGISRTSLVLIEIGQQGISLATLYKFAKALNKEVVELLPAMEEIFGIQSASSNKDHGLDKKIRKTISEVKEGKGKKYEEEPL